MKAAWILLEYILIFPDRRAPDWEMRHAPNRVKAARCGIDGMKLDVLKLQSTERVAMSWGVEQMGELAFHFCDALAHIHIPASVTIIGKLVFAG